MIRTLLALILAPLLIGAAAPRDWTKTVSRTVEGAYIIGNPQAKVRLIEYLSYTCPHCAEYSVESNPVLMGKFIKSGSTRVEMRHATRDPIDLAVTIAIRCTGPTGFGAMTEQVFATQSDWLPRAANFEQVNSARMALYPENAKLRAIADAAGVSDMARARGVSEAALDACFNDDAEMAKVATMSDAAWAAIRQASAPQPGGTPTFVINGKFYTRIGWTGLQTALSKAGAR